MELEQMKRLLSESENAYSSFADRLQDAVERLGALESRINEAEKEDDSRRLAEAGRELTQLEHYMEYLRDGIRQRIQALERLADELQRSAAHVQAAIHQLGPLSGKRFGAASAETANRAAGLRREAYVRGSGEAQRLREQFVLLLQTSERLLNGKGSDVRAVGRQWTEALSQEERSAIRDYTGNAYRNINEALRGKTADFAPGNRERAFWIHSALSRARLSQECVVYRGASAEALGAYRNLPDQALVGKRIYDDGFMSASLHREDSFSGEVKLCITAPKGAHGAYVGYISNWGHGESEVLFCDGQMMKITGVSRDCSGNRIIHARILLGGDEDGKV